MEDKTKPVEALTDDDLRQKAKDVWEEGSNDDLEIDDNAKVLRLEGGGTWVQAWVYLHPDEVSDHA